MSSCVTCDNWVHEDGDFQCSCCQQKEKKLRWDKELQEENTTLQATIKEQGGMLKLAFADIRRVRDRALQEGEGMSIKVDVESLHARMVDIQELLANKGASE